MPDNAIVQQALDRGYTIDQIADKLSTSAGMDPSVIRARGYDSSEILGKMGYSAPQPSMLSKAGDAIASAYHAVIGDEHPSDTGKGYPADHLYDASNSSSVDSVPSIKQWNPSVGEKVSSAIGNLFGMDHKHLAAAMNQYAEKQSGISAGDARNAVGGMSEIPEQATGGLINSATLGIIPNVAGDPQTTAGGIASGAGNLAGFLLGAPMKIGGAAVAKVLPKLSLSHVAGESFVKALGRDVGAQSLTLGTAGALSELGNAINSPDVSNAFHKEARAFATNSVTGAVFGTAGRLLPENTIAQVVARGVGISAALDAENGKTPFQDITNFDTLSPQEKGSAIFNYGLNAVFSLHGAGRVEGGWLRSKDVQHPNTSTPVSDALQAIRPVSDALPAADLLNNIKAKQPDAPMVIADSIGNDAVTLDNTIKAFSTSVSAPGHQFGLLSQGKTGTPSLNELADFISSEKRDVDARRAEIIGKQGELSQLKLDSGLESTDARVMGAQDEQVRQDRLQALDSIYANPNERAPAMSFLTHLEDNYPHNSNPTPEEKAFIAQRDSAYQAFKGMPDDPVETFGVKLKEPALPIAPLFGRITIAKKLLSKKGNRILENKIVNKDGRRVFTFKEGELKALTENNPAKVSEDHPSATYLGYNDWIAQKGIPKSDDAEVQWFKEHQNGQKLQAVAPSAEPDSVAGGISGPDVLDGQQPSERDTSANTGSDSMVGGVDAVQAGRIDNAAGIDESVPSGGNDAVASITRTKNAKLDIFGHTPDDIRAAAVKAKLDVQVLTGENGHSLVSITPRKVGGSYQLFSIRQENALRNALTGTEPAKPVRRTPEEVAQAKLSAASIKAHNAEIRRLADEYGVDRSVGVPLTKIERGVKEEIKRLVGSYGSEIATNRADAIEAGVNEGALERAENEITAKYADSQAPDARVKMLEEIQNKIGGMTDEASTEQNTNTKPDLSQGEVAQTGAKQGSSEKISEVVKSEKSSGKFGKVFTEFHHNARAAIKKLTQEKQGDAIGALSHPDIGDIDLVWGEPGTKSSDGFGLSKIAAYHPEVLSDLQGVVASMKVKSRSKNRIRLESADHKAAISLDWFGEKKTWLLTAYEKRTDAGATMDTASSNGKDDTARHSVSPDMNIAQQDAESKQTAATAKAAIKASDIPAADQIKLTAELRKGNITPEDVHSILSEESNHGALKPKVNTNQSGIEGNQAEGGAPTDFVKSPDGSLDFGEITPDMAKVMGRQPGEIRLPNGVQNHNGTGYGLLHIEANHGKQIRNAGFESVEEFVSHVAKKFNEILQTKNRQLLVAVDGGRQDVMFVQLEPSKEGDYYRINSAFPASRNYLQKQQSKGMKLLWGGSEPAPTVAGQQPLYADTPEKNSGQGTPIAQGQNSNDTVSQLATESKPTTNIDDFGETKEADKGVALYSRGDKSSSPSDKEAVDKIAQPMVQGLARVPELVTVQSVADLPFAAPKNAHGALWHGKIYLVADNLGTHEAIRETIAHELYGHFGLRGFFGDKLNTALNSIHVRNPMVAKLAKEWLAKNADVIKGWKADYGMTNEQVRYRSLEEAMSKIAQTGKTITGAQHLASVTQSLLRKVGLHRLANKIEAKTDAEAMTMLHKAGMFIQRGIDNSSPIPEAAYPLFSHGGKMERGASQFTESLDQSAAKKLNKAMAAYFKDDTWENAYVQNTLPDALHGIREAVKSGFGKELVGITPTEQRFDGFDGVNYGGYSFINLNTERGFINIAGHELFHSLEKERPDLHAWFKEQAQQYYKKLESYRQGLNARLAKGEQEYTTDKAENELLADFTGDALADPKFLAKLAEADGSKFRQLLRATTDWLKGVSEKLKGNGSDKYITDVEALRKHLVKVLVTYSRKDGIEHIKEMDPVKLTTLFSRRADNASQLASQTAKTSEGMTSERVTQATAKLRAEWRGFRRVKVVQSIHEIPDGLYFRALRALKPIDQGTEGLYDPPTRTVYLIADNIATPERAVWVAAHEVVGHGGIRMLGGLVGDALDHAAKNGFVSRLAKAIAVDRGEKFSAKEHTDEAIAELAAATVTGKVDTVLDRYGIKIPVLMRTNLLGRIKRVIEAVRNFVARTFGKPATEVSDGDIYKLLQKMKYLAEGKDLPGKQEGEDGSILHSKSESQELPDKNESISAQDTDWGIDDSTRMDDIVYKLQDKNIDLKRVIESIKESGKNIPEKYNTYLQEELFHGRAAKRTEDFLHTELKPLLEGMRLRKISDADLDEYLHARHAKEANALISERDPDMQDGGSGMTDKQADDYMSSLDPSHRKQLDAMAARVDKIIGETRDMYVSYGLIPQAQANEWAGMFNHYVPLMREDNDGGMGVGQGFSIKGKEVRHRTGSNAKVVDILANIALQREKVITRGEKNRVTVSLAGLVKLNPNPDFWHFDRVPTERVLNEKTGLVEDRADPMFKSRENVIIAKIADGNGGVEERAIVFNEHNERAMRMARAMKNLDATQLGGLLGVSAKITRYFASINTQYNPVFGLTNILRDTSGMALNLSSTPIAGKRTEVLSHILSAVKGIYLDSRAERQGHPASSKWAGLWEEMQDAGGMTGYRDLYRNSEDRANAIRHELDPHKWTDSKWGQVFTAGGVLKVPLTTAQDMASPIFDWLSDYNQTLEGATRLSAYKVAIDHGMSKQEAASLAKNITVNFNRKGQAGQQAGALYAFFNASMQGTARIGETMFDMQHGDIKTIRLNKAGKVIMYGGIMLGVMQAVMLAAAGFDDNNPPQFIRERNIIIPIGNKKYISIPMPLGYHILPNIGRVFAEYAMSGMKDTAQRVTSLLGVFADGLNPIGNSGLSMQTIAPTALDPFAAIAENKDWTGKNIAREDFNSMRPTPGFSRNKDTATWISKIIAEGVNYVTGGDKYKPGVLSPTADQIDYLAAQVGGGVWREAAKAEQFVGSKISGEELPTYKIPVAGKFYGDASDQNSQGGTYYFNLKKINEIEAELKGRRKDKLPVDEYKTDNPEYRLIMRAKYTDNAIRKFRKQKSDLLEKGGHADKIKLIDARISTKMKLLNDSVDNLHAQ